MAGPVNRTMPTPEAVRNMLPGSGYTGTAFGGWTHIRIGLNLTSTANAATNWINPEAGTVIANAFVCFTVAGTGTFDLGRGSDGTGAGSGMIDGGSMNVGVHYPGTMLGSPNTSATIGAVDNVYWLIGPGGTGTNNSINLVHNEIASTAVGFIVVSYMPTV